MSASNKKKARSAEESAKLTEKQIAEQKEAAKLKVYTAVFVIVLCVLVAIAAWVGVNRAIANSGMREKNTTAVTIGSHQLNNVELNYYYMDAVNNFTNTYGSYAALYGLDVTKPLNTQVTDLNEGTTWADDFLESAITTAQASYALADAAKEAGFELPEAQKAQIDTLSSTLDIYATMSGAGSADAYVKAIYGNGASKESYLEYYERNALASAFYSDYQNNLTYDDAAIRAADQENPLNYNSYSYNQYYLSVSKFIEDSETATDDDRAAAVVAAEAAVKSLVDESVTTVVEFDAAINALDVNKDLAVASTSYKDQHYTSVNSSLQDWISNFSRKEGDKTYVANITTDADGKETISGYYAVFFTGSTDNKFPMVNVRHILVNFQGGTTENGTTVYSDDEKAAAKEQAEAILAEWKSGAANEESFAALATEKTQDPGSAENGGLYENVYPGQMVSNFNDWCFDSARKAGDTGVVETEYGYHVMFFVGNSDMNYRDFMIRSDLASRDATAWYDEVTQSLTVTEGDTSYIRKDLVINANA